jgi:hypothetical protein
MKQFEVKIEDSPGSLNEMTVTLADGGINIISISSEKTPENKAMMKIITHDEKATSNILSRKEFEFSESDIITATLTDQPGELNKVTTKLTDAGVNMESIYIVDKKDGKTQVAIKVEKGKEELAKDSIKEFLTSL